VLAFTAAPLPAADVSPGSPAPAWQLQSPAGQAVQLSDFKGKVVVLDFWATWCPPCRAEIPDFVALQKQYGDKGLVIVGVSLDQGGPDLVTKFMQAHGMDYPVVMGNEQISDEYGGIQGIPTTFVIDRQGKIVSSHIGETDKSVFEDEIKKLL
jgi:thiol-disulfide isomerase/thioredoxin